MSKKAKLKWHKTSDGYRAGPFFVYESDDETIRPTWYASMEFGRFRNRPGYVGVASRVSKQSAKRACERFVSKILKAVKP